MDKISSVLVYLSETNINLTHRRNASSKQVSQNLYIVSLTKPGLMIKSKYTIENKPP